MRRRLLCVLTLLPLLMGTESSCEKKKQDKDTYTYNAEMHWLDVRYGVHYEWTVGITTPHPDGSPDWSGSLVRIIIPTPKSGQLLNISGKPTLPSPAGRLHPSYYVRLSKTNNRTHATIQLCKGNVVKNSDSGTISKCSTRA